MEQAKKILVSYRKNPFHRVGTFWNISGTELEHIAPEGECTPFPMAGLVPKPYAENKKERGAIVKQCQSDMLF